jgi:hypothetical protein
MRAFLLLLTVVAFGTAAANSTVTIQGGSPTFFLVTYENAFTEFAGADLSYGFTSGFDKGFGVKPYLLWSGGNEWSGWWMELSFPKGIIPLIGLSETWFLFGYQLRW